jgi:N-acetylglutamate synthase-like GNAT family acetyltransferase
LALLADYRNQGVGTLLIQRLQEQARPANIPLRLQVIRFNRAVNLLERLGFRRTSETGSHFQMEWLPGSVGSPASRGSRVAIPRGVVDKES